MRKPDFCLCENKGADQLCGNCEGDQRFCFRYPDSTIPPLPLPKISRYFLLRLYRPVCVRPGRKPQRPFSRVAGQIMFLSRAFSDLFGKFLVPMKLGKKSVIW